MFLLFKEKTYFLSIVITDDNGVTNAKAKQL
jgi:hypothetical protein